jgi:hypothetical protein
MSDGMIPFHHPVDTAPAVKQAKKAILKLVKKKLSYWRTCPKFHGTQKLRRERGREQGNQTAENENLKKAQPSGLPRRPAPKRPPRPSGRPSRSMKTT